MTICFLHVNGHPACGERLSHSCGLAGVATQFLTHVLINFQKKSKNSEKQRKKMCFLIYLHHF